MGNMDNMTAVLTNADVTDTGHFAQTVSKQDMKQILQYCYFDDVAILDACFSSMTTKYKTTKLDLLLSVKNDEGQNPVHFAAMSDSMGTLIYLKSIYLVHDHAQAAELNIWQQADKEARTPVLQAIISRCSIKVLDFLINAAGGSHEALVTIDICGNSPLHCAVLANSPELIEHLAKNHKMDINNTRSTQGGDSPAHLAVRHDYRSSFEALYKLGANCSTALNDARQTVLEVAVKLGRKEIETILKLPKVRETDKYQPDWNWAPLKTKEDDKVYTDTAAYETEPKEPGASDPLVTGERAEEFPEEL